MTVEQRPDDPAVEHARERLVVRLSVPFGDHLLPGGVAVYMQPLLVSRAAAEADAVRLIPLLK
jgi:hypothetical protein